MPGSAPRGFQTADECHEAFYRAMLEGNAGAMRHAWLATAEAVCIHPGGMPLLGFEAVMRSWGSILAHGGVRVRYEPRSRVAVDRLVIHTGLEIIRTAEDTTVPVTVTNIYQLTAEGWKLRLHHGAPVHGRPASPRPVH